MVKMGVEQSCRISGITHELYQGPRYFREIEIETVFKRVTMGHDVRAITRTAAAAPARFCSAPQLEMTTTSYRLHPLCNCIAGPHQSRQMARTYRRADECSGTDERPILDTTSRRPAERLRRLDKLLTT